MAQEFKYELLSGQKEYIHTPQNDAELDVSLYQGGYGSGKTFVGSLLGIILCLKYPGITGLVGAQTYNLLRDTTFESYLEHLDRMFLKEGTDWTYNKTENIMKFANGSTILFRHLQNPETLKSLNLGFVEIEEMSDVQKSTFDMLLSRLRQAKKKDWGPEFKYRMFGHTNPEQSKGWIYEYFVGDSKRSNYRRIISPTTDNIHLPRGYVDSLKEAYSETYFKINVMGQDCEFTGGLATKGFSRRNNVRGGMLIDRTLPIHVACDFNADPMCWYIYQINEQNIYILHEICEEYTTTTQCARLLAELLKDYKEHRIIINGDASGNNNTTLGSNFETLIAELRQCEFVDVSLEVMKRNPSIQYRFDCWNNRIRDKDGEPHIFIHPQCRWLIYDIENLEWEEGGNKPKKPSSGKLRSDEKAKFLTHPTDACGYIPVTYFPIQLDHTEITQKEMSVFETGKYEYERYT